MILKNSVVKGEAREVKNNILRSSINKESVIKHEDYKSLIKDLQDSITNKYRCTVIKPFELKTAFRSRCSVQSINPSREIELNPRSNTTPINRNKISSNDNPENIENMSILRKRHTITPKYIKIDTQLEIKPNLSIMKRPNSCSPSKRVTFGTWQSAPSSQRPMSSQWRSIVNSSTVIEDSFVSKEFPEEWHKISYVLRKGRSYTPILQTPISKRPKISVKIIKSM